MNCSTSIRWLLFVGANCVRPFKLCYNHKFNGYFCRGDHWSPAGLWFNHKFDICFLYGKSLVNRL